MNQKQMEAVILYHAFLDYARENSDYEFSEAEQRRFDKAYTAIQEKLFRMSETYFDEEVYTKIYGV